MPTTHPHKPPSYTLKYDASNFSTDLDTTTALFRITQVSYVKCIPSGKYIIAHLAKEEDYEAHLSPTINQKLNEAGLKLMESPEMLASRTLLARKVDDYILAKTHEALAAEISRTNNVTVEEVKVIPRPHMIKVRVSSLHECHRLLDAGLKLFSRVVPSYNLLQDKHTDTMQCYKCLQFTHHTAKCTATVDTCSKCGEEGHNFKNCTATSYKCYNCGGDHPAVAFKCPKKKEAIAAQTQQPPPQETKSYASAATPTPIATTTLPWMEIQNLKEQQSKSQQCLLLASEMARGDLANLTTYYTRLAQHNGLPTISVPSDLIEEAQDSYKKAYTASFPTPVSDDNRKCNRSRHSRSGSHHSRSRRKEKINVTANRVEAANTAPRTTSPRPSGSNRSPSGHHLPTSTPPLVAEATPEDEPHASSAHQRVTRHSNRDPRLNRT